LKIGLKWSKIGIMKRYYVLIRIILFILTLSIFYSGCAESYSQKGYEEMSMQEPEMTETEMDMSKNEYSRDDLSLLPEEELTGYEEDKKEERKQVFTGYLKLETGNIEEEKNKIIQITEDNGGYIESIYSDMITVRIPRELFEEAFKQISGLNRVLDKYIESVDVTEYFTDLETRLKIAETVKERLLKLLEKTEDIRERLRILGEIERLTEESESLRLQLELMEQKIDFSRIIINLVSMLEGYEDTVQEIPFPWIANLSVLYPSLGELSRSVHLPLGDEFAVFTEEKYFRAESPEGTRVRVSTTDNNPVGDELFWQRALCFHLSQFYQSCETFEMDKLRAVLFTSRDSEPYYYLVAVYIVDNKIYVTEAFFPDSGSLGKSLPAIKEALSEFEVK
jgi:hypothetical protein